MTLTVAAGWARSGGNAAGNVTGRRGANGAGRRLTQPAAYRRHAGYNQPVLAGDRTGCGFYPDSSDGPGGASTSAGESLARRASGSCR